ncbi:MAG TPA: ClpXP protease specificity-enhancing factor SspB [Afifellaceae bacterium]|nr:ClpXP protease specificity-enhancing factor SspB [Afifellaceae bacterium]
MSEDLIRYDILAQEAMRGVVRKVLTEVAQTGLPGEHHFFITFNTRYPGVRVSSRIREQYPEEMTIVLQHQFWDLSVTETTFEVGLSFNSVPERLLIPFEAITAFVDPHASFGLKLEAAEDEEHADLADTMADMETEEADTEPQEAVIEADAESGEDEAAREPEEATAEAEPAEEAEAEEQPEPAVSGGAEVVSLDAFRKKNG